MCLSVKIMGNYENFCKIKLKCREGQTILSERKHFEVDTFIIITY